MKTNPPTKNVMKEWKIFEKHLPESIYVRVYEERIDLLSAAIVGASGTPYHDGLFFFDISLPSNYPNDLPKVGWYGSSRPRRVGGGMGAAAVRDRFGNVNGDLFDVLAKWIEYIKGDNVLVVEEKSEDSIKDKGGDAGSSGSKGKSLTVEKPKRGMWKRLMKVVLNFGFLKKI